MKLLTPILIMLALVGCAGHAPPVTYGVAAQSGLSTVQTHLINASTALAASNAELSKPMPVLATVAQSNKTASAEINQAQAAIPAISKNISSATASYDALAKKYNALQDDWLGPKAHRALTWLVVIGILFVIGIIALQLAPTVGIPVLAQIATIAGHILTLGTAFLSKEFAKLLGGLVNKTASVVTSTPVVSPIAPPIVIT